MELKRLEVLNEAIGKTVICVCINYERFTEECDSMTVPRYRHFKSNPKNQFDKKATSVIEGTFFEKYFFPDLFYIRLNKRHSICNCQIDYTFELLNREFLADDNIRKGELSQDTLEVCLSPDIDYVMIYVGMNG